MIEKAPEGDQRIDIDLEMSKEDLFELFLLAHQMDMTFNQYVELILTDYIEQSRINVHSLDNSTGIQI